MQVVYRPKSYPDGSSDPAINFCYGRKWHANIPVTLTDADTVLQMVTVVDKDGNGRSTVGVERHVPITDACRGNPSFEIIGVTTDARKKPGRKAKPKTADEYRLHALTWFQTTEDADDLAERWESEADMRKACGYGDEDDELLFPQFQARYHQLNPDGSAPTDRRWAQMATDADAA